ncbi:MAG: YitT family protein [Anaerovoracaceae bacterium]
MAQNTNIRNIAAALVGIMFVGMGVAFNNCAGWGNDPIGIVYDGFRNAFGMNAAQLGMASNIINLVLVIFLFIAARKYVSIGTFVYLIPYGAFVSMGTILYRHIFINDENITRVLGSAAGCLLLCIGVSIYIAINIGVDPFTGIVLFLTDITGKQYRTVKVVFDLSMIVIGTILGGKLGIVTFVTALTVGPVIQFISERLKGWEWFLKSAGIGVQDGR